ncbi:flagellar brake protein [Rahnella sp. SAP-1]|uniref:Flagellar brake protein YcgR n=1 Tax=Rouxiella aceris TaxID=2703884 RepID=A0A848MMJ4_9GAMM|nr:flagellar brake protein [Rouxiella aceris]NMP28339.1 flagellar brake protein [Rouxiella aceris]
MSEKNKEQFIKRNKLGILSVLRDLKKNNTLIMINHARGQFISRILEVDSDSNQMLFDLGGVEYENKLALEAQSLNFIAEPAGAKVEFSCGRITETLFESLPTFSCEIPAELYFIQRREYFRVNIPLHAAYTCQGKFDDENNFDLKLKDISLGGLGLHVDHPMSLPIERGATIHNVTIDMIEFGSFVLDIEFISAFERPTINNKGETVLQQRLSFKFPHLSATQERDLQRAIFELEKMQHEKARRFQED